MTAVSVSARVTLDPGRLVSLPIYALLSAVQFRGATELEEEGLRRVGEMEMLKEALE